jgi:hypothetical protein
MDAKGSAFYNRLAKMAARQTSSKGREITIKHYSPVSDKVSGKVTKGTATVSFITTAAILPASSGTVEAFDNRLENGSLANREVRYVLAAALGATFVPASLDEIEFDSEVWEVLGCTPLNPGGIDVTFGMGVVKL